MNDFTWIEHMFQTEGFAISPKLHWFLHADDQVITPYSPATERYSILNIEWLQQQFPTLKCVPFARRFDRDDMFAVVLQDAIYERGQVVLFDIEDVNHYIIEETFTSLDAWAHDVWTTLEKYRPHRES